MITPLTMQQGKPIPSRTGGRRRYPWRDMNVNASFLVLIDPGYDTEPYWNTLTSCRANAQRVTGRKFTMRRVPQGIRVWRVE